jgi:hypothetical protein
MMTGCQANHLRQLALSLGLILIHAPLVASTDQRSDFSICIAVRQTVFANGLKRAGLNETRGGIFDRVIGTFESEHRKAARIKENIE